LKYNFATLVYNGIQQTILFYNNEQSCKNQGKIWAYVKEIENFACGACIDLPIPFRNAQDMSSCLTAYLQVRRTPQQIVAVLQRARPEDNILIHPSHHLN
jgi:hypothetical protein